LLKGIYSRLAESAARDEVALNIEEIVHSRVDREEALRPAQRLEAQPLTLASSNRLVRDFGSVVLTQAPLVVGT